MLREKSRWLMSVEDAAMRFYKRAAETFHDDKELREMLLRLEAEEKTHYGVIKGMSEIVSAMETVDLSFFLDTDSMKQTDAKLRACTEKLASDGLTKAELLHAIVDIEFSEHNDFFLYTVNSIKNSLPELISKAVNFDVHRSHIEKYLSERPEYCGMLEKLNLIPVASRVRLLVVDDERALAEAFNKLLADIGTVENAFNGHEALRKIGSKEYSAIITDVRMPVMDGVELYKKAVEKNPGIKDRFIFLTNYSNEYADFFEKNNIRYLEKPASIMEIKKAILEVMQQS